MNEAIAVPVPQRGLSQVERVVDTFVAPSKTFTDILRDTSWWLPLILMVIGTICTAAVVDKKVGFAQVTATQIHNSPKQEDAMNQLPPDQRAQRMAVSAKVTRYISYYGVPFFLLAYFFLYALILWGSFNFGLGAQTTYWQVFAVIFYAALPYIIRSLLTILTLQFGANAEAYDYNNPIGTNPGYYMSEAAPWLRTLLGRIDLIQLWTMALEILGMSIIAKKTIAQSATVILSLWLLMTIFLTVIKFATS